MAGDLLLTGLSGLTAFRNVLNTTAHNIANVNTDGYSRQRVELDARDPQLSGSGYVGRGVNSGNISRLYDQFLSVQFRNSSSAATELDAYFNFASQVDNVLANQNIGLSTALQDFFNAVQGVADDPTSIPARQVLLTEGEVLENRFNTLDNLFSDLSAQVNSNVQGALSDVNNLAEGIATLNQQIVVSSAGGNGAAPNDLLDARDKLIDDLSKLVNVSTNTQENGAINIFIGSGQSLVLGSNFNTLGTQPSGFDPGAVDIVFQQPAGNVIVTKFMTGGRLGGAIRFRNEVLDPAINTLGQVAVTLAFAVNEQHKNGIDLNGNQGLNFFSDLQVGVVNIAGSGSLNISFANTAGLTSSDYSLTTDATNTNYTIRRLSDNTVFTGLVSSGSVTQDGLTFDLTGLAANADFRVRPTRSAAGQFSVVINAADEIAAALPVVSSIPITNTGSGQLNNISINGLLTNTLPPGVSLTYDNSAPPRYIVAGATGGPLAYDPSVNNGDSYTVNVAGFGDISFTLSGQPANTDVITLSDNAGGVGDNRNANLLSSLQTALTLSGGSATFQDVYGQIVADVGRRAQSAESNRAAQQGLLNQTIAAKDSVSGVNLDEEAADLIRFQQAYQAASQVVLTSRTIFDTLLGAFR
ncbi:MAG: flagellar hook-associated protein FlgK [Piscirickettsiaceae bacterium]|nr:MAG: flagellar hook-associated protein FlgK [Piscirickettsiaceae bacterium]